MKLTETVSLDYRTQIFFMLTEACRAQDSETPCDQFRLGDMSFQHQYSFISPGSAKTQSAPGYRITKHIELSRFIGKEALEKYIDIRDQILVHRLAVGESDLQEDSRYHVKVYIYCPPCACHIATALDTCRFRNKKEFVEFCIRIDHRRTTSCSASYSGIEGLVSVIDFLNKGENSSLWDEQRFEQLRAIDRDWLERQIYNFTEEERLATPSPTNQLAHIAELHKGESLCAAVILLGEADYLVSLMGVPPFRPFEPGRVPRETQLFRCWQKSILLHRWTLVWEREYMGTYSPRAPLPPRQPPLAKPDRIKADERVERGTKRSRSSASDNEGS